MRIVFMGTPEFSATILSALAREHDVAAVFTRPNAVSGRGSKLVPSPVRRIAESLNIPVLTPRNFRSDEDAALVASFRPDCVVVAAYGVILPRQVLDAPKLGCVNVHASLLPRWRGAAPIQRAILEGDKAAGVSIMRMEEGLDTGDFCSCVSTLVGEKNTAQLTDELAQMGAGAVLRVLRKLEDGACDWTSQDDSRATYANKIEKADVLLNPSLSADDNLRRVRASTDAAPARAMVCDKPLRVLAATAAPAQTVAEGKTVHAGGHLLLGCADGALELLELKPDGKKAMAASAWLSGLHNANDVWSVL